MLLSEDRFKVVRIDCGIASISPFRIDIPLSSKSIQFSAKITKVELGEVLGPPCLSLGQHLSSRKVFKVFMIYDNINRIGQTF